MVCYSYRIHELLLRTCIEIESNFKAILFENGYSSRGRLNIDVYKIIDLTHHLSSYEIEFPTWYGNGRIRKPFLSWKTTDKPLKWFQAYNKTKHNRHGDFHLASFENLIDAVSGLLAILSSQFYTHDYTPIEGATFGWSYGASDEMKVAIGKYFRVKFPNDWHDDDKYDFNWAIMSSRPNRNPIEKIDYNLL